MNKKISISLCINRLNSGKEKLRVCELLYNAGFYKDANIEHIILFLIQ